MARTISDNQKYSIAGSGLQVLGMNLVVFLAYWGVSHINWLIFESWGVLPMPIWPAAGLALAVAIFYGWSVAPGIALATIFAKHFSLSASWTFAGGIAIMNTVGPLLGASIIKYRVRGKNWTNWNVLDVLIMFFIAVIAIPSATAIGGIGCKWMLGFATSNEIPNDLLRWATAHALGTMLIAPPVILLLVRKWSK